MGKEEHKPVKLNSKRGNPQNLIPFGVDPKRDRPIKVKGGQQSTQRKKEAAKKRELKKLIRAGKIKTKQADWLAERIINREAMDADLLAYADEIRTRVSDDKEVPFLNAVANIRRTIHGEKQIVESKNVNVNMDVAMSKDEIEDLFDGLD